jgi:hypothetical protein
MRGVAPQRQRCGTIDFVTGTDAATHLFRAEPASFQRRTMATTGPQVDIIIGGASSIRNTGPALGVGKATRNTRPVRSIPCRKKISTPSFSIR